MVACHINTLSVCKLCAASHRLGARGRRVHRASFCCVCSVRPSVRALSVLSPPRWWIRQPSVQVFQATFFLIPFASRHILLLPLHFAVQIGKKGKSKQIQTPQGPPLSRTAIGECIFVDGIRGSSSSLRPQPTHQESITLPAVALNPLCPCVCVDAWTVLL